MDVRVGLWRKLNAKELMLLNSGVGEDSCESPGLQGDPTSSFWRRSALGFLWKEWCWSWNSSTLATLCEELSHWKRLWCWEGLGAGGEGDDRGWDGWMASLTLEAIIEKEGSFLAHKPLERPIFSLFKSIFPYGMITSSYDSYQGGSSVICLKTTLPNKYRYPPLFIRSLCHSIFTKELCQ